MIYLSIVFKQRIYIKEMTLKFLLQNTDRILQYLICSHYWFLGLTNLKQTNNELGDKLRYIWHLKNNGEFNLIIALYMVEKVIFPTHFKGNDFTAIFIIVEKLRNLLLNGNNQCQQQMLIKTIWWWLNQTLNIIKLSLEDSYAKLMLRNYRI